MAKQLAFPRLDGQFYMNTTLGLAALAFAIMLPFSGSPCSAGDGDLSSDNGRIYSTSYTANTGWSTKGRTEELHLREQC